MTEDKYFFYNKSAVL